MLNKKFLGIVPSMVIAVSIIMLIGNFVYAKEEEYKLGEKALGPEYPVPEQFVCPSCKEVRVSSGKGKNTCCNANGLPGLQKRNLRICYSSL